MPSHAQGVGLWPDDSEDGSNGSEYWGTFYDEAPDSVEIWCDLGNHKIVDRILNVRTARLHVRTPCTDTLRVSSYLLVATIIRACTRQFVRNFGITGGATLVSRPSGSARALGRWLPPRFRA